MLLQTDPAPSGSGSWVDGAVLVLLFGTLAVLAWQHLLLRRTVDAAGRAARAAEGAAEAATREARELADELRGARAAREAASLARVRAARLRLEELLATRPELGRGLAVGPRAALLDALAAAHELPFLLGRGAGLDADAYDREVRALARLLRRPAAARHFAALGDDWHPDFRAFVREHARAESSEAGPPV